MSAAIRFTSAEIPKRFQAARLSDFTDFFANNRDAEQIIDNFLHNSAYWTKRTIGDRDYWTDSHWRCLFINGPVGVGKSHLLAAIAAEYSKKAYVKYTTAYDMSQNIMNARNADKYKGCGLLIIDEMGRTFETKAEADRFFDLINARYNALSPVIFCANLTKEKLRAAVGDGVADRMAENMSTITMVGHSRRIKDKG